MCLSQILICFYLCCRTGGPVPSELSRWLITMRNEFISESTARSEWYVIYCIFGVAGNVYWPMRHKLSKKVHICVLDITVQQNENINTECETQIVEARYFDYYIIICCAVSSPCSSWFVIFLWFPYALDKVLLIFFFCRLISDQWMTVLQVQFQSYRPHRQCFCSWRWWWWRCCFGLLKGSLCRTLGNLSTEMKFMFHNIFIEFINMFSLVNNYLSVVYNYNELLCFHMLRWAFYTYIGCGSPSVEYSSTEWTDL